MTGSVPPGYDGTARRRGAEDLGLGGVGQPRDDLAQLLDSAGERGVGHQTFVSSIRGQAASSSPRTPDPFAHDLEERGGVVTVDVGRVERVCAPIADAYTPAMPALPQSVDDVGHSVGTAAVLDARVGRGSR